MLRWILLLPLLVLLILFGLSNRQEVYLYLWPFDLAWAAPLSIAILLIGALCFLFGAIVAWVSGLTHRGRARRAEEAARLLEAEVAEYRAAAARTIGPVPQPAGTNLARLQRPAA
ncbi:MAG: conjugal transfer protein [Belnapia sp.]|nr:conjugal transfer protein [Belnapia sp.]